MLTYEQNCVLVRVEFNDFRFSGVHDNYYSITFREPASFFFQTSCVLEERIEDNVIRFIHLEQNNNLEMLVVNSLHDPTFQTDLIHLLS